MKKAIVLLSGGLDSTTALYYARSKGYDCECLIFDYGQRHKREIEGARRIALNADCRAQVVKIELPRKGSSLLDKTMRIPKFKDVTNHIPSTYVPARNIIFLSFALSYAETIGAQSIFIGANAIDYSGYPDCKPEFFEAFKRVIGAGTKTGSSINIETPLIGKTKKEIVELARQLGVPLELTWSCYKGGEQPCGVCDSCGFRARGFSEAGVSDPLVDSIDTSRITEVFTSVQGEGIFAGESQVFVRFAKCNLSCDYCDTAKKRGTAYSAHQLLDRIRAIKTSAKIDTISLTGGEPLLHADFLARVLPTLKERDFKVYLETNGTLPDQMSKVLDLVDIVAMDMKMPSSQGGRSLWPRHKEFLRTASKKRMFVKIVVTDKTSIDEIKKAVSIIEGVDSRIPLVVQPVTPANKIKRKISPERLLEFQAVAKSVLNDVRIIPQMHKALGVK